ncbi:MAG: hypothetical protein ACK5MQ_07200 [Pikeienuella sp.]
MIGRALVAAICLAAAPAAADEVETSIEAALDAWRAGNIAGADEALDQAASLLGKIRVERMAAALPAPLAGWTRAEETPGPVIPGASLTAGAIYERGDERLAIRLMIDGPILDSMVSVLGEDSIGSMRGELREAGAQRYIIMPDGDFSALVSDRVYVNLRGDAPREDLIAYFEAIDFAALGEI